MKLGATLVIIADFKPAIVQIGNESPNLFIGLFPVPLTTELRAPLFRLCEKRYGKQQHCSSDRYQFHDGLQQMK